jgi:hypothetical protein
MAYKISGILSENADIYVIDEATDSLEAYHFRPAGAYEVGLLSNGAKIVTAVAATGQVIGYGNVTPEFYVAFEPSGSPYAWFDAQQEEGYNDLDPIGTFIDRVGGHHVYQGTVSKRPLYRTDIQNGLPVIRWDGVNDKMQNTGFGSITQPATYFIAGRFRAFPSGQRMFTGNDGGTRHDFGGSGSSYSIYAGGGTVTKSPGGTDFHVFSIRVQGSSSWIRVDGSQAGNAGTTGTYTHQGMHVGAYYNDSNWSQIDIGDFLVYKGAEDPAANEAALAIKWGL